MRIVLGMVVKSNAGHDKGLYFVVVGQRDNMLLIADGKRRRVLKPKLKKPRHLIFTNAFLQEGEYQTNRNIKKGLRSFKESCSD